jgi:cytochrome c553
MLHFCKIIRSSFFATGDAKPIKAQDESADTAFNARPPALRRLRRFAPAPPQRADGVSYKAQRRFGEDEMHMRKRRASGSVDSRYRFFSSIRSSLYEARVAARLTLQRRRIFGPIAAALLVALPGPAAALDKAALADLLAQCAACHGAEGIARDVEVPNLAGQHDVYLLNQLHNFRSGRRPHKEMRYMSRHTGDAELEAIARYYSQLPH